MEGDGAPVQDVGKRLWLEAVALIVARRVSGPDGYRSTMYQERQRLPTLNRKQNLK